MENSYLQNREYIDASLFDKATLWTLRIILKLGAHKEFIDKDNYFSQEELVYFLGFGKYAALEVHEYKREELLAQLKTKLIELEKQTPLSSHKLLSKNIEQIALLMNLNEYEKQILEFVVIIKQYEILDNAVDLLGNELNTAQVKRAIGLILDIPKEEIDKIFASDSKFSRSSLVKIDKKTTHSLKYKLDSISDHFLDNLMNLDEDISVMIKDSVKGCDRSELKLKDYKYLSRDLNILMPYLQDVIAEKKEGVNILLYGIPGTGKTELVKVIAEKLKAQLFEVSYTNEDDEPIDGRERLIAYKSAQVLLANKRTLLMYDEAEDIFESGGGFFSPPSRQKDKAWINRVLESNSIPTIWITNNISSIDNALIRRFDMSIEIPIPKRSKREEIIKKYSHDFLDEQSIKELAKNENIAPALLSRSAKVVGSLKIEKSSKAFRHLLNNTLKAQGHSEIIIENGRGSHKSSYNPNYINTTTSLKKITEGIKRTESARVCLYGAPGTGKSAYGEYLAEELKRPLLLKKGSDLICKFVGGTEKNIAAAFKEAKEEGAILVFDEVDSFLADRADAKQSWEVTQVNEMLVQMEKFDGIFIATTNLMENLDKASLRRFDLKLEFSYMLPKQAYKMFKRYAKNLNLDGYKLLKERLYSMRSLTPGDFAAVVRQNRFHPIESIEDFFQRLEDEVSVKNLQSSPKMGFLASREG